MEVAAVTASDAHAEGLYEVTAARRQADGGEPTAVRWAVGWLAPICMHTERAR